MLEAANFSVLAYESYKDHPKFAIENLKVRQLVAFLQISFLSFLSSKTHPILLHFGS